MLFALNGSKLGVKFYRNGTTTTAELIHFDESFNDYMITNIKGISYCNPKDRFEKSKGRKIALAKLLKKMNEFATEGSYEKYGTDKEQRAEIWNIYFSQHNK